MKISFFLLMVFLLGDISSPRPLVHNNDHLLRGTIDGLDRRLEEVDPFPLPFIASPFDANAHYNTSAETFGACVRNGFDAQYTDDLTCLTVDECNLGFTNPGEFVAFAFEIDEDTDMVYDWNNAEYIVMVDVIVRVASANEHREIELEIRNDADDQEDWPVMRSNTPGVGWQDFEFVTWSTVRLNQDVTEHTLFVNFVDGYVNMCSVQVRPSRVASFRAPALEFSNFYKADPLQLLGTCGDGLVDAQPTEDVICVHRDQSVCNIGWTEPGEWVSYDFTTVDPEDYDIWVRIANNAPGKTIRVEVEGPTLEDRQSSFVLEAPGLGWQEFVDVGFHLYLSDGHHRLTIYFETGQVNLCSVRVEFSVHWSTGEKNLPQIWNALEYDEAIESQSEHLGNCPIAGPVDSRNNQDDVCLNTGPCHVAFTEPGEMLRYDFATDIDFSDRTGPGPLVDIRLRLASLKSSHMVRVEVDGYRRDFVSPGGGWDNFQDFVLENVPLKNTWYHPMYIVFLDGRVNLCLVEVTRSAV